MWRARHLPALAVEFHGSGYCNDFAKKLKKRSIYIHS